MRWPLRTLAAFGLAVTVTAGAADELPVGYTLYGTPGLIEMPSALALPDAQIGATIGGFQDQQRASFTFQITPRLTGTFRYSRLDEFNGPGTGDTYDRSFDLQYQLFDEGETRPAVAIGLRDFLGTGRYSGEYIAATKTFGETVRVTGGIGWGRLGSYNGFTNPLGVLDERFETRPSGTLGQGGVPTYNQFFRGDAALFGGVEWQVRDDLTLIAEYSSDAYTRETRVGSLDHDSPLNFGLRYRPRPGYELGAYYLRGNELGVAATIILDPKTRSAPSGIDSAPFPVNVRGTDARAARSWNRSPATEQALSAGLAEAMALDGITVDAVEFGDRFVRIRYVNTRYRAEAQAVGHMARILTAALPPAIEEMRFEPMRNGVPVSSVTMRRSDLEELENTPDATWRSLARTRIGEAGPDTGLSPVPSDNTPFKWGLSPYVEFALFDPDQPIRADYGVEATARYTIQPNLVLSGTLRYQIGGNAGAGTISPSSLQPVRRNGALYGADGGVLLENLALHWYGRPGEHLYSRVSVGYLERMFAGVSSELLWKPVDSRLALGAELNYVAQRDYDMGFGLQHFDDIGGTYEVLTGHASAYYDFENGFHGRIDVGRYLAGDWGATFALDREFANGWRVGAYATFTDVSFEDFGEGSFDKGIIVTIPLDWALGQPTRRSYGTTLSSLQRDGGARLRVDGRLYDTIRDGHEAALADSWGRFWR